MDTSLNTVPIPAGWPATEEQARAVQDELRGRVVLDEPGPPPGTGTVTGVDVAYDDERDVVVAAAVVLDAATLAVVAEATAVGQVSFPTFPGCSPSARSRPCWPCSTRCRARRVSWSATATVSPTPAVSASPATSAYSPGSPRSGWPRTRSRSPTRSPAPGAAAPPAARGRTDGPGGGRSGTAHPGRRQAGLRLGRPPGEPRQRLRAHPRAHPEVPPPGDHPKRGLPVPAGPEGDNSLRSLAR